MAKHEDPQVVLLNNLSTPQDVWNSDRKLATKHVGWPHVYTISHHTHYFVSDNLGKQRWW